MTRSIFHRTTSSRKALLDGGERFCTWSVMQTEVLLYSVITHRDMKSAGQLAGEIQHGLGTHLNDLSRYISLAVLCICCATEHISRDRVGTEHLHFVVSPGYGGDLLLMAGRTRRGAINAKLAT